MELIKIICETVVNGFLLTFVAYCCIISKSEVIKLIERVRIIGNIIYKSFAAASVISAFIALVFGLTGYVEKTDTINIVTTFLMYALIFLVFSFSFSPPKIMSKLFSK